MGSRFSHHRSSNNRFIKFGKRGKHFEEIKSKGKTNYIYIFSVVTIIYVSLGVTTRPTKEHFPGDRSSRRLPDVSSPTSYEDTPTTPYVRQGCVTLPPHLSPPVLGHNFVESGALKPSLNTEFHFYVTLSRLLNQQSIMQSNRKHNFSKTTTLKLLELRVGITR